MEGVHAVNRPDRRSGPDELTWELARGTRREGGRQFVVPWVVREAEIPVGYSILQLRFVVDRSLLFGPWPWGITRPTRAVNRS